MWDRLRQKDGGGPMNRKKLEAWQKAHSSSSTASGRGVQGGNHSYQYSVKGGGVSRGPAPKRPQRGGENQNETPDHGYLTAQSATGRYPQRDSSYGRPTSSVYSQPSPEAAVFAARQLRNDLASDDPLEISPPSSPDLASPKDAPNPGDVSPIDETPAAMSQPPQQRQDAASRTQPRSNIPMMRRERRKNSNAALQESKSREQLKQSRPYGNDVRWDPRTGEPTTDEKKGRPSQVNPQEYVQGLKHRTPESTTPPRASQPNPQSFRDRLRPVRQASASPQPDPSPALRPEWRGASGRTNFVAPVKDSKHVPPLKIPPRNAQRTSRTALSPIESNGSEATASPMTITRSPPPGSAGVTVENIDNMTSPQAAAPVQQPHIANITPNVQPPYAHEFYPSPPSSENAPVVYPAAGGSNAHRDLAFRHPPPLHVPSNEKAIRRKPARGSEGTPTTPLESAQNTPHSTQPPFQAAADDQWVQPPSRFSITTYATSHLTSTPRQSVDESGPPLPTPPQPKTPTPAPKPQPVQSILTRGRPIISGYESSPRPSPTEAVKIVLDSHYYASSPTTKSPTTNARPLDNKRSQTLLIPKNNQSRISVASISSVDKSLPPAPPEASATDRVTELNAMLQSLANRRININKAIRQMTEMMPTDNILASEAVRQKREDEKRKVEALRLEQADVERQSYELGLKLHRAYKRLDRDAEYEPTTLWVRRVTG
ncbi:hypothetical protein GGR57DRAFT_343306 [Xylariaceae sp. FL1272]|nr:hypothetical protein GGR57DRAFT_343306 [Xylariaceae sp. FL1272]